MVWISTCLIYNNLFLLQCNPYPHVLPEVSTIINLVINALTIIAHNHN